MRTRLIAAILLGAASFACAGQAVEVRDETLFGRPVKTLDNGLVRVSVTPQIGGRVLDFRLNKWDRRMLRVSRENIGRRPDEPWQGAEYGGLCDVASLDWPGPFWGVDYKIEERQVAGNPTLRLTAEADGIGIRRDIILAPDSTILRIEITQTNLGKEPREMVIRLHGEFAVGDCADDNDVIMFRNPKGLEEIKYRLGWENPRFSFENPSEGWIACVDTGEKLALIRRFFPPDKDLKVLVWHGFNEGGPVRDEKGGFYAIDRFAKPQRVEPGKSITAAEEFYVVEGLPRVDFVAGDLAGAVVQGCKTYCLNQIVWVAVLLGGASAGGPCKASVAVVSGPKEFTTPVSIPPHEAGGTAAVYNIEAGGTSEGAHQALVVSVRGATGEPVATVSQSIPVDRKAYVLATSFSGRAQRTRDAIVDALIAQKLQTSSRGKMLVELATYYMNCLGALTTAGEFERAIAEGPALVAKVEAALRHAKVLEPAQETTERAIAELLRELR